MEWEWINYYGMSTYFSVANFYSNFHYKTLSLCRSMISQPCRKFSLGTLSSVASGQCIAQGSMRKYTLHKKEVRKKNVRIVECTRDPRALVNRRPRIFRDAITHFRDTVRQTHRSRVISVSRSRTRSVWPFRFNEALGAWSGYWARPDSADQSHYSGRNDTVRKLISGPYCFKKPGGIRTRIKLIEHVAVVTAIEQKELTGYHPLLLAYNRQLCNFTSGGATFLLDSDFCTFCEHF